MTVSAHILFLVCLAGTLITAALLRDVWLDHRAAVLGGADLVSYSRQIIRHEIFRLVKQFLLVAGLFLGVLQLKYAINDPAPAWMFVARNALFAAVSILLTINSLLDLQARGRRRRKNVHAELMRKMKELRQTKELR
jgi:hypothetical protein